MAPQQQPLDESEFDAPWFLPGLPGGNMNRDSILWYFMNSQFYDGASNNQSLFVQLRNAGPEGQAILSDGAAFQQRLLANFNSGFHFIIAAEPQAPGEPWVIQRQAFVQNPETGKTEMEVQATFYSQGTKILMAPSLLDVLQLRLLSCSTQLDELFALSKDISHFSPATGHSYLPPSYELRKATLASRADSRLGSPSLNATQTTDVDVTLPSQSQSQSQPTDSSTQTTTFSDALFLDSLNLTNAYYHEYMDENPLQGEPGSFVFTNTHAHVYARNMAQEKQQQQQQEQAAQKAAGGSAPASAIGNVKAETQSSLNSRAATPKTGTPAAGAEGASRKASVASLPKLGKEKRGKSKGLG